MEDRRSGESSIRRYVKTAFACMIAVGLVLTALCHTFADAIPPAPGTVETYSLWERWGRKMARNFSWDVQDYLRFMDNGKEFTIFDLKSAKYIIEPVPQEQKARL